jgi:7-keto-8-aminopelargonate synthetase-like enzyme
MSQGKQAPLAGMYSDNVQPRACRDGLRNATLNGVDAGQVSIDLRELIHSAVVRLLRAEVDPGIDSIDHDAPLTAQGLDSICAAAIAAELERVTGVRFGPELVYEHGTINRLAEYLVCRSTPIRQPAGPAPAIGQPIPDLDALSGSMAEFANPCGPDLAERLAAFDGWRTRRREAGVWPFSRVARSPAAPTTTVASEDGAPQTCINFASQDYLGLARDPRVLLKAQEAIAEYGVHSAGSPVLLGTTAPMAELEKTLAGLLRKEDCLVFPTGWAAGFGVITGLVRPHDTLILDALCHRCLMEGASHVTREPLLFRHNDLDHLGQIIRKARERDQTNGLFVVSESLYSMDSDSPDLLALVRLVRQFDAILILDVAHDFGAMGVRGLGLLEQLDGTGLAVDVLMGSFSKTFAATGGFIAGDRPVVDYLRVYTTSFVFSNAISPVQSAAALECCKIAFSAEGQQLRSRLKDNVLALRSAMQAAGCRVEGTPSPVVPVFVGAEREARLTAREIAHQGLLANLVEYPAVPQGRARFRFQVMATHTPDMAQEAAELFSQAYQQVVEETIENAGPVFLASTQPTVRSVVTSEEQDLVYRFRYAVYVEEKRRNIASADHERRLINDSLDTSARIIAAFDSSGKVVGSLRVNLLRESNVGPFRERYQLGQLSSGEAASASVSTRYVISRDHRNGALAIRMVRHACQVLIAEGITHDYAACRTDRLPFFAGLGYKARYQWIDEDGIELVAICLDVTDLEHLRAINSPLLPVIEQHALPATK